MDDPDKEKSMLLLECAHLGAPYMAEQIKREFESHGVVDVHMEHDIIKLTYWDDYTWTKTKHEFLYVVSKGKVPRRLLVH